MSTVNEKVYSYPRKNLPVCRAAHTTGASCLTPSEHVLGNLAALVVEVSESAGYEAASHGDAFGELHLIPKRAHEQSGTKNTKCHDYEGKRKAAKFDGAKERRHRDQTEGSALTAPEQAAIVISGVAPWRLRAFTSAPRSNTKR